MVNWYLDIYDLFFSRKFKQQFQYTQTILKETK